MVVPEKVETVEKHLVARLSERDKILEGREVWSLGGSPMLGSVGRRMISRQTQWGGLAYLATVEKDGRLRVHPISPRLD